MATDLDRMQRVEGRTEDYVHSAKRLILDLFGPESAQDHTIVTLQLATAMMQLEAAEIMAAAYRSANSNYR